VMVQTEKRNELRNYLFQYGVFPAIHWLDSMSDLKNSELSFHIDHRYSLDDLVQVVELLKRFYKD